jgi:soluble lytic murein transglycosylase-like protein
MTLNLITLLYISNFNQVDALLHKHAAKGVDVAELSAAIKHEAGAMGVDPILLTKIAIVESKGRSKASNKKTGDMGVLQINKIHKISKECAFDVRCNVRFGANILRKFMNSSGYRPCMYNVGYKVKKRMKTCMAYERKLNSFK